MIALELMLALSLSVGTFDQPTRTAEPISLAAVKASQEQAIAEIDQEIIALLVNKERMDKSATLKAEEAASLRLRFPAIRVGHTFNTDQFIAALRAESQRTRKNLGVTLASMEKANRATSCSALTELRQTMRKLHTDPEWLRFDAKERLSIRAALDTMIAETMKIYEGDPCLPFVESPRDVNMDMRF